MLLDKLHASNLAGHLRIRKMLAALQKYIWCPEIAKYETKLVKASRIF